MTYSIPNVYYIITIDIIIIEMNNENYQPFFFTFYMGHGISL